MTDPKIPSVRILCADMRHAWEPVGDTVLVERQGQVRVFTRTLQCLRCETQRVDTYRIAGHAVFRVMARYRYPEGYRVPGGLKIEDVRWALFGKMKMVTKKDKTDG